MKQLNLILLILLFWAQTNNAASPTFENVAYGPHPRNVLDFWQAKSDIRTPVIVFIHGGGFINGDKTGIQTPAGQKLITRALEKGVSWAAINYRLRNTTTLDSIMLDCARAIQFLRSQSDAWKIDKSKIAAYGSSAGGGASIWLAFHDDLADPLNSDPVLRESSRLTVAGHLYSQATYDCEKWSKIVSVSPNWAEEMGFIDDLAFYGITDRSQVNDSAIVALRKRIDMLRFMDKTDPPVYLHNLAPIIEPQNQGAVIHHPRHAIYLKNRCDSLGIESVLVTADVPPADRTDMLDFFFRYLLTTESSSPTAPGQPQFGPGGNNYHHASVDRTLFGSNITNMYWLFEPADPKPDSAFVVVYWHGTNQNSDSLKVPAGHLLFIEHLAKKGYTVVFPLYQYGGNTLPFEQQLENGGHVVSLALAELQTGNHPRPFLNSDYQIRYAMTGASRGGGMTLNVAAFYQTLNLPPAEALCAFVPSAGKQLEQIPVETKVLIVSAENDSVNKEAHSIAWQGISHIPCQHKNFLQVNSDDHGVPPLIAEHEFTGSGSNPADSTKLNTLDFYGAWKLAVALFNCTFYGTDCEYCLTSSDSITDMGRWSDGVPVKPISILDSCATTRVNDINRSARPQGFSLLQNYPNPFNPVTIISFYLPQPGLVQLKLFDLLGREVKTILNREMPTGTHSVKVGLTDLSGGIYFYSLMTNGFTDVKKCIFLK